MARLRVPITPRDHVLGDDNAPVTVVEYGDYESICAAAPARPCAHPAAFRGPASLRLSTLSAGRGPSCRRSGGGGSGIRRQPRPVLADAPIHLRQSTAIERTASRLARRAAQAFAGGPARRARSGHLSRPRSRAISSPVCEAASMERRRSSSTACGTTAPLALPLWRRRSIRRSLPPPRDRQALVTDYQVSSRLTGEETDMIQANDLCGLCCRAHRFQRSSYAGPGSWRSAAGRRFAGEHDAHRGRRGWNRPEGGNSDIGVPRRHDLDPESQQRLSAETAPAEGRRGGERRVQGASHLHRLRAECKNAASPGGPGGVSRLPSAERIPRAGRSRRPQFLCHFSRSSRQDTFRWSTSAGGAVRILSIDDPYAQAQLPLMKPGHKLTVIGVQAVVVAIDKRANDGLTLSNPQSR